MHDTVGMSIVEALMAEMAAKWLWVREKLTTEGDSKS
jgi:hypothetical protein